VLVALHLVGELELAGRRSHSALVPVLSAIPDIGLPGEESLQGEEPITSGVSASRFVQKMCMAPRIASRRRS
jgi:hypothetical protein